MREDQVRTVLGTFHRAGVGGLHITILIKLQLISATVFGDPHVYTFDNQAYTFNGMGEYVLVRANTPRVKLDVQGRFEQVFQFFP
jgi:hypothetical protein